MTIDAWLLPVIISASVLFGYVACMVAHWFDSHPRQRR